MTFFEQELKKILHSNYPEASFIGRACYVYLDDMNRAKIQFATCGTADHYEALQLTILNRNDGQVDSLRLRFADVWGKRQIDNPYVNQNRPYAWTYNGKTEWYAYHPSQNDYAALAEAVDSYLGIFMEHTKHHQPQWYQSM